MRAVGERRRLVLAFLAAALHPSLWPVMWKLVPPHWWRRWPPLPLPPPGYMRFRLETMYGGAAGGLEATDLVTYLKWCRRAAPRAR